MVTLLKNADLMLLQKNEMVQGDILIEGEKITALEPDVDPPDQDTEIIDCSGWQVFPGFFDMHVHFREPGQTHKEDIKSGLRAAAAGGFTGVAAMANTSPAVDNPGLLKELKDRATRIGGVEYHQIAAATQGLAGKKLLDIESLLAAGAVAISDDGQPIKEVELLQEILRQSAELGFTYIEHCEDQEYEPENPYSEIKMVYRDINCLAGTGGRLHLAHISCGEALDLVAEGKKDGLNLTCEVTPHHLFLSSDIIKKAGTRARMNPPLRTKKDVQALQEGVAQGLVDVIATDHAPHTSREKNRPYARAPRGIIGLETAVGVVWEQLWQGRELSPLLLGQMLAHNPREVLNLPNKEIGVQEEATLTIIDPEKKWRIDPDAFYSRSCNTPFAGENLRGKPILTFQRGVKIMEQGRVLFSEGRN